MPKELTNESLKQKYARLDDELKDLINPQGTLTCMANSLHKGQYGSEFWLKCIPAYVRGIGVALAIQNKDEAAGENFLKKTIEYVKSNLVEITENDLKQAADYADGKKVSNCQHGSFAAEGFLFVLEENDFFNKLDKVYTTLEIISNIGFYERDFNYWFELDYLGKDGKINAKQATEFHKNAAADVEKQIVSELTKICIPEKGSAISDFVQSNSPNELYRLLHSFSSFGFTKIETDTYRHEKNVRENIPELLKHKALAGNFENSSKHAVEIFGDFSLHAVRESVNSNYKKID